MINWRYVKGYNEEDNATKALYTFLYFSTRAYDSASTPSPLAKNDFENTPKIYINNSNGSSSWGECGHIITQKAINQSIDTAFTFNKEVRIANNEALRWYQTNNNLVDIMWLDSANNLHIESPSGTIMPQWLRLGSATAHTSAGDFSAGNIWADGNINAGGNLIAGINGMCQARFFNATSDSRAKTNLKPLSINALDLINRVQLYSFKYKDSDLPSIGILAQDVQDVNIEGFDLVDNKQASGVDMDYMSIHESKLTYILWKAIQEQQKEIEELKIQIKNLTK